MNFDFKIKMSGAVARRIAYLHKIMKLDIDPRILEYVERDLLSREQVEQAYGGSISDINLKVCQFAADTNFRCVIGAATAWELQEQLLMAALASGSKIVIVDDDFNSVKCGWKRVLVARCITHKVIDPTKQEELDDGYTAWVVNKPNDAREIVKRNRDRVLIYSNSASKTSFSINSLFGSDPELQVRDLAREFPKSILGFHIETKRFDRNANAKFQGDWVGEVGFKDMVNMINCNDRIANMLSYGSTQQRTLQDFGFTLRSPGHIGRVLNVNTDLLHQLTPLECDEA